MSSVNIDHEQMGAVANSSKKISESVREHFNKMDKAIEEAGQKDVWSGVSSENWQQNYNSVKGNILVHLQQLEDLSPALERVSQGYTDREEENAQQMRTNNSQERGI